MTQQPVPELLELKPHSVAVIRETVPVDALPVFFDRVFPAVLDAVGVQGARITGPPVGVYYGTPSDTIDVAGGFPVDREVAASSGVTTETLPGGRAVQMLHVGGYDSMAVAYERLIGWMAAQNLTPSDLMWEVYLTEPDASAPESIRTLIVWPVVE